MLARAFCLGISALAALAAASPARAADAAGTEIHLTQQASRTMAPDRIRVALRIEAVGADAREIQAETNRRMEAMLAKAKAVASVKFETGAYSVYPANAKDQPRWHAVASFALTSADFGAALALAGALQEAGALMSGVEFSLAPETLAAAEDELTAAALASLRRRADAVAKDLGVAVDHFKTIDVGNAGGPPFMPRAFMMSAQAAASSAPPPPVAEPADITVSLTVNADIILAPAKN
jgi:uncharacterized protein